MATPHDIRDQEAFEEHPLVTELLVELQAIEEKTRVAVRFFTIMDWSSQNETQSRNESLLVGHPLKVKRSETMLQGMLLWLLGIPLGIVILLWLFHVI